MFDEGVERRYLPRAPGKADRRAFRIFVARAGEPLVDRMAELAALTTARATRGMTEAEQSMIVRQLTRACDNLAASQPA
jgi:DNA-binding MarR family transcriptional regulator